MSDARFKSLCESANVPQFQGLYSIKQTALILGRSKLTVQGWAYGKSKSPFSWLYQPSAGGNGHWSVERSVLVRYVESFQCSIQNLRIHRIKSKYNLQHLTHVSKAIA